MLIYRIYSLNLQMETLNIFITMNHFKHAGLNEDSDYKRDEIIRKIEHAVERMTLKELEALSYDMFTKGYFDNL